MGSADRFGFFHARSHPTVNVKTSNPNLFRGDVRRGATSTGRTRGRHVIVSTSNDAPWSLVVWAPAGAFIAARAGRWIDAYDQRLLFERRHGCLVTIEPSDKSNIRYLPEVDQQ